MNKQQTETGGEWDINECGLYCAGERIGSAASYPNAQKIQSAHNAALAAKDERLRMMRDALKELKEVCPDPETHFGQILHRALASVPALQESDTARLLEILRTTQIELDLTRIGYELQCHDDEKALAWRKESFARAMREANEVLDAARGVQPAAKEEGEFYDYPDCDTSAIDCELRAQQEGAPAAEQWDLPRRIANAITADLGELRVTRSATAMKALEERLAMIVKLHLRAPSPAQEKSV